MVPTDINLKYVGIVGLGTMGRGIAQVIAHSGYSVIVVDQTQRLVTDGIKAIHISLRRMCKKKTLDGHEKDKILSRIHEAADISDLSDCDLIIEAAYEDLEIKKTIFQRLETICQDKTIFASNTSSLSITRLASSVYRPNRLVGMHFFHPVPVMQLVEIIKTIATSSGTLKSIIDFIKSINKKPIVVKDQAGFLVNFLLTPYLFDAVRSLSAGLGTLEDIDNGMRLGCAHPMGPLALCDLIGLDILANAGQSLFEEHREQRYAPPPLLLRLVEFGDLGIKTGKGFYDYREPQKPQPRKLEGY